MWNEIDKKLSNENFSIFKKLFKQVLLEQYEN